MLLKKDGKNSVLDKDNDLMKITKKLLTVMGPLGVPAR